MKIMYVIHSLCIGGAETITVEYLLKLKEAGHDVCLIEFRRTQSALTDRLVKAGVPIVTLNGSRGLAAKIIDKLFGRRATCKKLNKVVSAQKPDIVHIHTSLDLIARLDFDMNRVFYSFHTSVERSLAIGKVHKKNLFGLIRRGMNVLVLSDEMKNDAMRFGIEKVNVLPNGIDIEHIRSLRVDREETLKQYGVPNDAFVLCHAARMHPVKNHVKTVGIFKEIIKIRPDSYLLLIGAPDEKILNEINRLADEYSIRDRVKILGGKCDAVSIMGACDAMVLPSFTEGFSLVAAEAQALGIRCVLTDSVPDEVVCNDNCFKLSVDRPDSEWAEYVLGDFVAEHEYSLEDLEIGRIINKLEGYYTEACLGKHGR